MLTVMAAFAQLERDTMIERTRTPSATGCAESRNTPADPSRGQGMSPNCVWRSRSIAI